MPGPNYVALLEVAFNQHGYVTPADARAKDIDPAQLRIMRHRRILDRVAHGVYRFPIVPSGLLDQYMEAALWPRARAALSHETALDLYELSDVNPTRIHVTVPRDYRIRRDVPPSYELHPRDLDPGDVTLHEGIPIVTVRRAILDGIEACLGEHLLEQAIATAVGRGLLTRAEMASVDLARRGDGRRSSGGGS